MGVALVFAFVAFVAVGAPGVLAAETATSRQMREYYQSLKNAQTPAERDSEIKDGYKNKVGSAAITDFKKNQEEFKRKQPPYSPTRKTPRSEEKKKQLAEKHRLDKAARVKAGKSPASLESENSRGEGGRPTARLPVPDSRPAPREEVVIDGRDIPVELEFSGKPPAPSVNPVPTRPIPPTLPLGRKH